MKANEKRALILVDWQNDYFPGGRFALENVEGAAKNAKLLLDSARAANLRVIHVQHLSLQKDAPFFIEGTTGVEIHSTLAPAKGETVIVKHYPNSFRETGLLNLLKENQIEELVVTGAMSHMCIDAVVRGATDFGFRCLVAHDACATRELTFGETKVPASQVHAAFMSALAFGYAQVLSTSQLIES